MNLNYIADKKISLSERNFGSLSEAKLGTKRETELNFAHGKDTFQERLSIY